MGDYAEMILDGEVCATCGEWIGDEIGYPRECEDCKE